MGKTDKLLTSNEHKFGFKAGHATDLCIFTLKQIVEFYRAAGSNVYVCFLDASKAFDRVNHWFLFEKLLKRDVPNILVRLLCVWYSNQEFCVKWSNCLSTYFKVTNGVRQGGIMSPILFNTFINDLSVNLLEEGVGCHLGTQCMNHLFYADDSVLLAPSPSALQKLIHICEQFALDNEMLYNPKKSTCMCFRSKEMKKLHVPTIFLDKKPLDFRNENVYLGIKIREDLRDDDDIERQRKCMYAKGNVLIRNFKKCTNKVKCDLFRAYCTALYCAHILSSFKDRSSHALTCIQQCFYVMCLVNCIIKSSFYLLASDLTHHWNNVT